MDQQIIQLLNEIDDDLVWFKDNLEDLKKLYNNKFVAIKNRGVLASDKTVEGVIKILKKKKEDPKDVIIQFVSRIPRIF